jgi:hypothetical protein
MKKVLPSMADEKGYLTMGLFPYLTLKRIVLFSGIILILFLVSQYNIYSA